MNTVKKGDKFEEISFGIIKKVIKNRDLGIIPEQCTVFKKKKYFSVDRKSDIIFDLSIEVIPKGAKKPVLIFLIECKDYGHKIPVNELEEFYGKVQQIRDSQVKSVFITTNTFQSGAYNYANSKNIMLITVNETLSHSIILHKTNRFIEENQELRFTKLFDDDIPEHVINKHHLREVERSIGEGIISGFVNLLGKINFDIEENQINTLGENDIEEIVNKLLESYCSYHNIPSSVVNLKLLYEFLFDIFELTITYENINEFDIVGRNILSKCLFRDKKIVIDSSLKNSNIEKFIVMHEVGHFILHNKLVLSQSKYEETKDSEYSFSLGKHILKDDRHWLEWQANHFSACLLMPKKIFSKDFAKAKVDEDLDPSKPLYVDDQRANIQTYNNIISVLSKKYSTTKTSIIFRLKNLGWLIENYDMKHIGIEIDNLLK